MSPLSASPSPPQITRGVASAAARAVSHPVASHITVTRVRVPDGSVITVAVFGGPVRYVLHDGSRDPHSAYSRVVHAGPTVGAAERRQLEAAFNGGS